MVIFFYIALSLTVFCVITLLCAPLFLRPSQQARRILDIVTSDRPDKRTVRSKRKPKTGSSPWLVPSARASDSQKMRDSASASSPPAQGRQPARPLFHRPALSAP